MGLDADLGIDSIKRVEILSALAERLPDAPVVGPEKVGELQTLAEVAAYLGGATTPSRSHGHGKVEIAAPTPARRETRRVAGPPLQRHVVRWKSMPTPARAVALPSRVMVAGTLGDPLVSALQSALRNAGAEPVLVDLSSPRLDAHARGLLVVAASHHERAAFELVRDSGRSTKLELLATISRLDGRFGVDGLDPDVDPIPAALAGLAKTAAREWS